MADKKISALAVQAALDGTEQVEVLVGGTNKRMLFGLGYVRGAPEQTASFTAAPFFEYPLDTTSATPIVQTLPAAPPDGTLISGKWTKGANATATAVCSGTDHFNTSTGATSVAYEYLNTKYDFLYVASIGVWLIETSFSKSGLQLFLQSLDSDLTAIAALATTAYGRSLLTLASQSAYATLLAADAAFTSTFAPLPTALVSGRYYRMPSAFLTTSAGLSNGSARCVRKFIPAPCTIDRIGSEVTVVGDVGSKFRLGIWNDLNGRPDTLLLDAGQIAGDSATVQELTVSQALARGWYWFGGVTQSTVTVIPTLRIISSTAEPLVGDIGTSTPAAGAASVVAVMAGMTAALTNWTFTATASATAPSIFVRMV